MIKKSLIVILTISAFLIYGCVKETYDMEKLSGKGQFSPTFALSAVKGNVSFSDLVKLGDTIVFDENKFVKAVFRKDSVINFRLKDFFDLDDMVSFSQSYELGVLSMSSFQGSLGASLNQIAQHLPPFLSNQLRALDDGAAHIFPPLPSINLDEKTFSDFQNFDNAVFHSGYLDITVTNNLTAPISGITVNLYNSTDNTSVGTVLIPDLQPGQSASSSADLTDKRVTKSIKAAIVINGSPGTTTPVIVSLNSSNINITARGRDLRVRSGRIILPQQTINTLDNKDTVTFNPGFGIELDEIKVADGDLTYHIQSGTALAVSMSLTLPTIVRGGSIVSHTINAGTGNQYNGSISFDNTLIDLGSDPAQPYNLIPLEYEMIVGSNGVMTNFNSTDRVEVDLRFTDPEFGYIKGYFGQQSESIDPDTLDLDIDDILNHLSGDFLISNPSIRLSYSNSFAIPLKIDFQATGRRGEESVGLGLDPVDIASPQYPASRDVTSAIIIDKNNSDLPELISLPPGNVIFSGTAIMNSEGDPGLRNNYIFGDSRFLGSVEVEVPLEFRMSNLQFNDTLDNFLKEDEESDSPVKPENFELLQLDLTAKNGFPLGVSVKMSLYDERTNTIKSTIDAASLLEPAPVDANGKSNGVKETTTNLKLTREFFDSVKDADKIIVLFTLNSTSGGTTDVRIYSDNSIEFRVAMIIKPKIIFN